MGLSGLWDTGGDVTDGKHDTRGSHDADNGGYVTDRKHDTRGSHDFQTPEASNR